MSLVEEPKHHFSGGIVTNPVFEYRTPSPEFELMDHYTSESPEAAKTQEKREEMTSNYIPVDVLAPSSKNHSPTTEEPSIEVSRTATTRSALKPAESVQKLDAEIEKLPVQRSIAEATKKRVRRPPNRDDLGYVAHPQPKRRNSVQRKKSVEKETKKSEDKIVVPPVISEVEEAPKPELNMDDINALCPAISTFDDSMEPPAFEEPKTDSESEWEESGGENAADVDNKKDNAETSTNQTKQADQTKPITENVLDEITKDSEVREDTTVTVQAETEPEKKSTKKAPMKRTRKKATPKTEAPKKPTQRRRKTPIIIPPPEPVLDQSSTQTEVSFEQILESFDNIIKFQKSIGLGDAGPEDPSRKVI